MGGRISLSLALLLLLAKTGICGFALSPVPLPQETRGVMTAPKGGHDSNASIPRGHVSPSEFRDPLVTKQPEYEMVRVYNATPLLLPSEGPFLPVTVFFVPPCGYSVDGPLPNVYVILECPITAQHPCAKEWSTSTKKISHAAWAQNLSLRTFEFHKNVRATSLDPLLPQTESSGPSSARLFWDASLFPPGPGVCKQVIYKWVRRRTGGSVTRQP
jgi:hypothetical protein